MVQLTKSIHEFDWVMEGLSIDVNELGAVMLPVEPFELFGQGRSFHLDPEDLYASNDPSEGWVAGDVTGEAHITLLYGLLKAGYNKEAIDGVLKGWAAPMWLDPQKVSIFHTEGKPYSAIVVEVEHTLLRDAHARLSYLPHVNTFPEYKAHVTLAYVKAEKALYWQEVLSNEQFHIYPLHDTIDYGFKKSWE